MHLRYGLLISIVVLSLSASAQPKREFRGVWIATVSNIDWPVSRFDSPAKQQSDLAILMDSLALVGFNAVVFQVRPSADALYPSAIEPWSEWLTGVQGQAPDPVWDPLEYAISQAHYRGMEFHAWFNPYRTVVSTTTSNVSASHISNTHPEWNLTFGALKMLDPGLPEVREYVNSVIMDVVRRYDIDGVHFDDYFYPYAGITTEDAASYAAHGGGMPLGDWRRENVNQLVKMVHDSIRVAKPHVKFGISPFGIWRNQTNDPLGSATSGLDSYSAIYTDARRWLQEGWLDYVTPQVYWKMGFAIADYSILAPWWSENTFSRHLYIGQAPYRVFDVNKYPVKEILNQIALNRSLDNVHGSIHFSAKYFQRSTYSASGINDSIRNFAYQTRALRPTMAWIDAVPPMPPESLTITRYTGFGRIRVYASPIAPDSQYAVEYLLYRSFSLPIDFSDMGNVIARGGSIDYIEDTRFYFPWETGYFAATALDRHQNESSPSNMLGLTATGTVGVNEEALVPTAMRLHQNFPNPFNPVTMIGFEVNEETHASLRVYDLLGREVAVLWEGMTLPGFRQVSFDGAGLSSGTYFYRLIAMGRVETRRMQLVK